MMKKHRRSKATRACFHFRLGFSREYLNFIHLLNTLLLLSFLPKNCHDAQVFLLRDSRSNGKCLFENWRFESQNSRVCEPSRFCIVKRNIDERVREATASNVHVFSHRAVICIANANTSHTHRWDPVGGAMYSRISRTTGIRQVLHEALQALVIIRAPSIRGEILSAWIIARKF